MCWNHKHCKYLLSFWSYSIIIAVYCIYVISIAAELYQPPDSTTHHTPQAPHKFSSVEKRLNYFLVFFFIIMMALCALSIILADIYIDKSENFWPLDMINSNYEYVWCEIVFRGNQLIWFIISPLNILTLMMYYVMKYNAIWDYPHTNFSTVGKRAVFITVNFFVFLLLYSFLIPISLYVTLEMQKLVGAMFINWDMDMYDHVLNEPATAKTSGWNCMQGCLLY